MSKARSLKSVVKRRRRTRKQRGGIILLLALALPALAAVGKPAALGGISGAVGFGTKRLLERRKKRRRVKNRARGRMSV